MAIQLPDSKNLETMSISELSTSLNTTEIGLTTKEAQARLAQFGANALAEKKNLH